MTIPPEVQTSFEQAAECAAPDWWPDSPNTIALLWFANAMHSFLQFISLLDDRITTLESSTASLQDQLNALTPPV